VIGQRHIYDRHHPLERVWSSTWRDNTPRIGEPHALVQDPYIKSWAHDLVCDCPVGGVIRGHIANIEARRAFVTEFASDSHSHPTPTPLKPLEPSLRYPKGGSTPQYIARLPTFSPIICDTPTPAAIPFQYPHATRSYQTESRRRSRPSSGSDSSKTEEMPGTASSTIPNQAKNHQRYGNRQATPPRYHQPRARPRTRNRKSTGVASKTRFSTASVREQE